MGRFQRPAAGSPSGTKTGYETIADRWRFLAAHTPCGLPRIDGICTLARQNLQDDFISGRRPSRSSSEGRSPGKSVAPRVVFCCVLRSSAQRAKSSPDCSSREKDHATIPCANLVTHHLQHPGTSCVPSKSGCPRRDVSDVKSSCPRKTNGTCGIEDELLARWAERYREQKGDFRRAAVPGLRPSLGEPTPLRGSHPPPRARNRNGLHELSHRQRLLAGHTPCAVKYGRHTGCAGCNLPSLFLPDDEGEHRCT